MEGSLLTRNGKHILGVDMTELVYVFDLDQPTESPRSTPLKDPRQTDG
jgi:hypothetical protein